MQDIVNHNCQGLCASEFCDNPEEQFEIIEYNKLRVFVALCNEHARIWDNNFWEFEV